MLPKFVSSGVAALLVGAAVGRAERCAVIRRGGWPRRLTTQKTNKTRTKRRTHHEWCDEKMPTLGNFTRYRTCQMLPDPKTSFSQQPELSNVTRSANVKIRKNTGYFITSWWAVIYDVSTYLRRIWDLCKFDI
jgi:hypothetical protein